MKNCKEIVVLFEQSLDQPVGRSERMKMRTHFILCKACKAYSIKSAKLHHLLKRRSLNDTRDSLSSAEKEQIAEALRNS